MIVSAFDDSSGAGVELMALDKGRGIEDLAAASADGYSTAGSPGTGLGSIRRQSNSFHVFSKPTFGTAILARILGDQSKPLRAKPAHLIGAVLAPTPAKPRAAMPGRLPIRRAAPLCWWWTGPGMDLLPRPRHTSLSKRS